MKKLYILFLSLIMLLAFTSVALASHEVGADVTQDGSYDFKIVVPSGNFLLGEVDGWGYHPVVNTNGPITYIYHHSGTINFHFAVSNAPDDYDINDYDMYITPSAGTQYSCVIGTDGNFTKRATPLITPGMSSLILQTVGGQISPVVMICLGILAILLVIPLVRSVMRLFL